MNKLKLAAFIGIFLLSAALYSCLYPVSSFAELQIKAQLLVHKAVLYTTTNRPLAAVQLSKLTADSYQNLLATSTSQLQRQLDAQLLAAQQANSDSEAQLYLQKALLLEQQSDIALDSSGQLLFTRAMLQYQLQPQQAINLFISAIEKLDQSESDQLLNGRALNYICKLQAELGFVQSAQLWCEQFSHWTTQSGLASTEQQSNALELLANLRLNSGMPEQARDLYLKSIQQQRQLSTEADLSLANSLQGLAAAYDDLNQFVLAESALLEALSIINHHQATTVVEQSQLLNNIAENQAAQGKYEQAFGFAERAFNLLEHSTQSDESLTASIANQLGSLAQDLTRYDIAEKYYLASLSRFQSLFNRDHPSTAAVLNNLGSLYSDKDDYEKSKGYYEKALRMRKAVYGETHIEVVVTEQNLALVYQNMDDIAAAISLFEKSLTTLSALLGPQHPHVSVIAVNLGRAYSDQDDPRAEALLKNALVTQQNQLGAHHPKLLPTLYGLAKHYYKQQQFTEAEMLYLRALKIAQTSLPASHSEIAHLFYSLARLYQVSGNFAAAEQFYKKELAILRQTNSSQQEINGTLKRLVQVLEAMGKTSEAQQISQQLQQEGA